VDECLVPLQDSSALACTGVSPDTAAAAAATATDVFGSSGSGRVTVLPLFQRAVFTSLRAAGWLNNNGEWCRAFDDVNVCEDQVAWDACVNVLVRMHEHAETVTRHSGKDKESAETNENEVIDALCAFLHTLAVQQWGVRVEFIK
jgi:hypothetical protein